MNILVTGGAGYIGSHTVCALAATEGLTPVVLIISLQVMPNPSRKE